MFSILGFLSLVTACYGLGREATKVEIEYKCEKHKEASLATKKIYCKPKEDLKWVQEI